MRQGSEADRIAAVAEWMRAHAPDPPRVGLVLGSGLGGLAAALENGVRVSYAACDALPPATVAGHKGEFAAGRLAGVSCALLVGRYHVYEGYDAATVVRPVRALARLGIEFLIVTNSAGGLRSQQRPGDLMLIDDHINLLWSNPLIGAVLDGEVRFPDMSRPYDEDLLALAERVALREGIHVQRGVYVGTRGPSYETPAEIRMFARMGAHAVGMSTVPEVIAARVAGLPVLGISVITNLAAGLVHEPLQHEDVVAGGAAATSRLARLIRGILAERAATPA